MKVISKQEYTCVKYTKETVHDILEVLEDGFADNFSYTITPQNEMIIYTHGYRGYWRFFLRINDYLISGNDIVCTCYAEDFENEWAEVKGDK